MKEACVTNSDGLMEQLYEMIDRLRKKERNILGIGVASIGPVDVKKGMIDLSVLSRYRSCYRTI